MQRCRVVASNISMVVFFVFKRKIQISQMGGCEIRIRLFVFFIYTYSSYEREYIIYINIFFFSRKTRIDFQIIKIQAHIAGYRNTIVKPICGVLIFIPLKR